MAKRWLKWIAPLITPMDDALAFVRAFRALRDRLGRRQLPLRATWVNIAFSHGAIASLVTAAAATPSATKASPRDGAAIGFPWRPDIPQVAWEQGAMAGRRPRRGAVSW